MKEKSIFLYQLLSVENEKNSKIELFAYFRLK
jgi:hypothetical protein